MDSWTGIYTVDRVDLVRLYFDWNENANTESKEGTYTYKVAIRSVSKPNDSPPTTGFCDISLTRYGKGPNCFTIRASYYYSLLSGQGSGAILREDAERELSKTIIWTRFREIAAIVLNQAYIQETIPLVPDTITYTNIFS